MIFNGDNIQFTDGTASINIKTWLDFPKFVEDNKNLQGYICRGHARSSFTLIPTIVRLHQERHSASPFDSHVISKQLRWFRLNIRGRVTLTDREAVSESEVWAIGQHNGLATPLLDWTASPLVAAFFAFIEDRPFVLSDNLDENALNKKVAQYQKKAPFGKNTLDEDRTIFVLNARKINRVFYDEVEKELEEIGRDLGEYLEYMEDEPEDGQGFSGG